MNKKPFIIILIILLMISGMFIGLKYLIPNQDLFSYNLMEILTAIVVTTGIYFLTQANNDIKSKNQKVEETIDVLKNKFNTTFNSPISEEKYLEYLHTFKYIDNKIEVLVKLSIHLKCEDDICEIKKEKEKLDEFISENIGEGKEYFLRKEVKEKIPNILCNIETHLDNIILQIYKVNENKK